MLESNRVPKFLKTINEQFHSLPAERTDREF
jgi:hypothetical protein